MMFGRKRSNPQEADAEDTRPVAGTEDETALQDPGSADADADQREDADLDAADDELDDEPDEDAGDEDEDDDPRADGPFDIEEVDLGQDDITRIDLGSLILTPWQRLNLQLQVHEATQQVRAVTGIWRNSGLEISLFAAPASGGLADDLREELVEEAQQAGGTAELARGPFGTEVRRVMPQTGPQGQQLFHVSRIWFAEGPRWLLRGTLLGEAALAEGGEAKAGPFVEFFRNLVVRRGDKPMVPGELITMELPTRDAS